MSTTAFAKKVFLLRQSFSILKDCPEKSLQAHVTGAAEEHWRPYSREDLVHQAQSREAFKRVAIAVDAGLGKTTNTAWLRWELCQPSSKQFPFLLNLALPTMPELISKQMEQLDDWLKLQVEHQLHSKRDQLIAALIERRRSEGRITFIIDGLDHAISPKLVVHLQQFMTCAKWKHCNFWLTGRPYAFDQAWNLFQQQDWTFLRVNPLKETDIREYLNKTAGGDWFNLIPKDGRGLLRNPRLLRLMSGVLANAVQEADQKHPNVNAEERTHHRKEALEKLDIRNGADVYARAYFDPGKYPTIPIPGQDDSPRGLLASGVLNKASAEEEVEGGPAYIGLRKGEKPLESNFHRRITRAATMLGAIAFEMFAENTKKPDAQNPFPRPNLTGIPLDRIDAFQVDVHERLQRTDPKQEPYFFDDWARLQQMNTQAMDFLLFKDLGQKGIAWHDPTVQAFFAAYWAANFADETDRQLMRQWITNAKGERLKSFWEFWRFVAEMPDRCQPGSIETMKPETWKEVLLPCYVHPHLLNAGRDKLRWVEWHREMLILSFPHMKRRFPNVINDWRKKDKQHPIWKNFMAGFKPIPTGDCYFRSESEKSNVKPIYVDGFRMHQYPVTNKIYELFDPSHKAIRWSQGNAHPLGNDDDCPVVNVNWFDASCFALWCGNGFFLPIELQWEHAARAGSKGAYWWGDREQEIDQHAWYSDNSSGSTHPVGAEGHANQWGMSDMLGHVWEWCNDNYNDINKNVRGGSWISNPQGCRVSYRNWGGPDVRDLNDGFRLASCLDFS